MEGIGSGSGGELCDEDMMHQFEAEERANGVLNEEEIEKEVSSRMLGRYLEKKWKTDGNSDVFLASGRAKKLPGSGNLLVEEVKRCQKIMRWTMWKE